MRRGRPPVISQRRVQTTLSPSVLKYSHTFDALVIALEEVAVLESHSDSPAAAIFIPLKTIANKTHRR